MLFTLGNLIVVLAALSLSQVTVWRLDAHRGPGTLILIGGVIAAYTLDRFIDADAGSRKSLRARTAFAFLIAAALIVTGLLRAPNHLPLAAALALIAGAYVPLKRLAPKGVINAAAWAAAVVWLPCDSAPSFAQVWPLALCMFLLVAANAILCDTLDIETDRSNGVRGLAPWLGERRAARVAAALAIVTATASIALGLWPLVTAAIPLACLGLLPIRLPERNLQRIATDLLMIIPGASCLVLA